MHVKDGMVGVISTRHLLTQSATIVHEFGGLCLLRCFWRTLTADHAVTFLECALPPHIRFDECGRCLAVPMPPILREAGRDCVAPLVPHNRDKDTFVITEHGAGTP
jgi:hypothetical protein